MDPNALYSYLSGNDEPTVAEQGKALMAALRRKQGGSELLMATGDAGLMEQARAQQAEAGAQQGLMAQAAGGRLSRAMAAQQAKAAQDAEAARLTQSLGAHASEGALTREAQAKEGASNRWLQLTMERERTAGRIAEKEWGRAHGQKFDEDGNPIKSTGERAQDRKDASVGVPVGWEQIDPENTAPPFASPSEKVAFADKMASLEAMNGHAETAKAAFKKYLSIPWTSPIEKKQAAELVNQAMNMYSAKSRVAEGLNSSDQANSTAEAMIGLQHGSAFNVLTMMNEDRLPGLLDAATRSSRENVLSTGKVHGIRPKEEKPAAKQHEPPAALKAPEAAAPPPRRIVRAPDGQRYYLNDDGTPGEKVS